MAVTGNKKTCIFGIHSLKKAIKKLIRKTRPTKEEKKVKEDKVYRVDFEAEIEDNLANEALEARFIQIIEASPAALDLNLNLKGSLVVGAAPEMDIQFGTFWTVEDNDSWDLCRDLFLTPPAARPAPTQAA